MFQPDDTDRLISDAAYRDDMRHRFVTDHFFAAETLGYAGFHPIIHAPVKELYFGKNPNLPIEEQDPIKNRIHLDPRFTYKTTWGRIDKVQWIAAFPKIITILNQTATQPLAHSISRTIASFFYCPKFQKPTRVQLMFPELVVNKEPFSADDNVWNTPVHDKSVLDATIAFTSPMTTQSGWHPWVLNADDMVDAKNSGLGVNADRRQRVIDTFDTNKNVLIPGGYLYLVGTRYHPFDLYGVRLNDMDPDLWKVLVRVSVIRKDGARLLPGEFPAEDECILPFDVLPGMNYQRLRSMFYENYETYMAQQQNDPQGGNIPVFEEKMYFSCETNIERVPQYGGEVYVCWRMPYGTKPVTNRFMEGAAARIVNGKVFIIDCWRIGGTPSHQAERIAQVQKELHADGVMILDTPGAEGFAPHIRNEAAKKNLSVRIQWLDWDDTENVRRSNIKQIEPMMKVGRVLFSRGMTKASDCRKQFVHFGLIEEDGIIECVSKLTNMVPISQLRANMEEEEIEYQRRQRENAMLNSFLMQQGMPVVDEQSRQKTEAHLKAMEKATRWTMPPLPGGLDG